MANILIADDSSTLRHQLAADLKETGHNILEACDGEEAIEQLRTTTKLALVILDINMPGANGIEVLQKRREENLQPEAVIFMLTTDSTPELKEAAKKLSVKAWITKPYQKEALLNVVTKVLAP